MHPRQRNATVAHVNLAYASRMLTDASVVAMDEFILRLTHGNFEHNRTFQRWNPHPSGLSIKVAPRLAHILTEGPGTCQLTPGMPKIVYWHLLWSDSGNVRPRHKDYYKLFCASTTTTTTTKDLKWLILNKNNSLCLAIYFWKWKRLQSFVHIIYSVIHILWGMTPLSTQFLIFFTFNTFFSA